MPNPTCQIYYENKVGDTLYLQDLQYMKTNYVSKLLTSFTTSYTSFVFTLTR
jgi:hypothetical protein